MLRLETYKIFKRKLVWIVLLGCFLLVIVPGVYLNLGYFANESVRGPLLYKLEKFEKHKGVLTDKRLSEFFEDYTLGEYDYMYYFLDEESGQHKSIHAIFPDIDFDIHFGYFELWCFWLGDTWSMHMKYIAIFIAITFSAIFTYENECGMQEILLSTKKGRKECTKSKVAAAFLATNIVYILLAVLTILPYMILTHGTGWDTSIQMIPWIRDSQLDMNFLELTLHTFFLTFIALNVILLITLCASFLAKSPVAAMCITFGILFFIRPDLIDVSMESTIANRIAALTPMNVLDTVNLAAQIPVTIAGIKIHWLILAEIIYSLLLIGGGIFFFKVMTKHQKYYAA